MALIIWNQTKCVICGAIVEEEDDIVTTTHFISSKEDPLWRYSDSCMHKRCFLAWEHRAAFVEKYNAVARNFTFDDGTYHEMQADGTIRIRG